MNKISSKELRNAWIRFYEERGHINIGAVSLIGDGSTGVMFNVAGMQPLMPYLLGKEHPSGKKRLCNVQGCVRTVDIESVGDPSHFTFFEMMGNWSLGDYFKKEKTQWSYDLLTRVFGLDRMLAFLNGLTDGYKTDLFLPVIRLLEEKSGFNYDEDEDAQKAMRIVADHIRTSTMLIGDVNGILPSNVGAGYILRRLLRRSIRYTRKLGLESSVLADVSRIFIEQIYDEAYPLLVEKEAYILDEIMKEAARFEATLATGMKEFTKCITGIRRKNEFMAQKDPSYKPETEISGKQAFRLYDTYGFPLELTEELAAEEGLTVDADGFAEAFKEHQQISKQEGTFKGGLAEQNEITARLHTATHLLHAALRSVLGDEVAQKGSNITTERLRFDFSFGRKMTPEEIQEVERLVNVAIDANVPVVCEEMTVPEAKAKGAIGLFESKYGETVRTYKMGDYSFEICGGPHAANTGELGSFKIRKEESSSAGVRRIKATIQPKA